MEDRDLLTPPPENGAAFSSEGARLRLFHVFTFESANILHNGTRRRAFQLVNGLLFAAFSTHLSPELNGCHQEVLIHYYLNAVLKLGDILYGDNELSKQRVVTEMLRQIDHPD